MNNLRKIVIAFLFVLVYLNISISMNFCYNSVFNSENLIEIANEQDSIFFNDLDILTYRVSDLLHEDLRILDNMSMAICYDLLIDENYLYTTGGDFNIFNITNPWNASSLGTFEDFHQVNEVFINDSCAYIGRGNFSILDIANKSQPLEIGSYEKEFPNIRDVEIAGDLAFILDSYDGLIILNISDQANPQEIRTLWGLGGTVRDIYVEGNYAYMAEGYYGLWILDISNPKFPSTVSRTATHGDAREVRIEGNYVFLSNWNSTEDLMVFNIENEFSPISVMNISIPQEVCDFTIEGNYLYLVSDFQEIYVFDITNPEKVIEVTSWKLYLSGGFWSIDVDRGLMAIAIDGFYIMDHDIDDDGIFSYEEYLIGTDPFNNDSDMDQMPDGWEREFGLNLTKNDATDDNDMDGLSNLEEYQQGKNPIMDDVQPIIYTITHNPILVTYQDEVLIYINTSDPNGIAYVSLKWNVTTIAYTNNCTWNETLFLYQGVIPAYSEGKVMYQIFVYDIYSNYVSSTPVSYDIIPEITPTTTLTSITSTSTQTETKNTSGYIFTIAILSLGIIKKKKGKVEA